jgi:hypothetical protein
MLRHKGMRAVSKGIMLRHKGMRAVSKGIVLRHGGMRAVSRGWLRGYDELRRPDFVKQIRVTVKQFKEFHQREGRACPAVLIA